MIRLKPWQLAILALPIAIIVIFLLIAAGWQIHRWRINWIWGVVVLIFALWRWLLAKWTKPPLAELEATIEEAERELTFTEDSLNSQTETDAAERIRDSLQEVLAAAKDDPPIWEDWQIFWQRCQELVTKVSQVYHPEVKRPLLNIYIPQAYGLIRGTVDDTDRLMQKLTPVLEKVSIGQAYEAYEVYRKLEPSARKLGKVLNWSQWLLNPAAAIAKRASKYSNAQANQQLIANLGQLVRETALKNLCQQAIALYGKETITLPEVASEPTLPKAKTQTIKEIIETAEPQAKVEQKPVNILLIGRTGAGKSSVINTLFRAEKAEVDVLPSTDRIKNYHWTSESEITASRTAERFEATSNLASFPIAETSSATRRTKETLNLWDTPGYEQVNRPELKAEVLEYAATVDLILLVTPALDPALQMDVDFLSELKAEIADLPAIAIVTQVDRLRPIREWNPPYDWQQGDRPKEKSIRDATQYRAELLEDICNPILPLVTEDRSQDRDFWNIEPLSTAILNAIDPAKQLRLARFLRDRETRSKEAARIIDRYTRQMSTTQGLTALLKSPILQFVSTMTTGNPALAYALAEQIPVEQLPLVIGKLQMAYDLFGLLSNEPNLRNFDLLSLWSLLLENEAAPDRNAWAFGHALVEYWTKNLNVEQLRKRYQFYLEEK